MASFLSEHCNFLVATVGNFFVSFSSIWATGYDSYLEYLQCMDSKPCVCVWPFERSKEDDAIIEVSYYEMKVDLFIAVHEWLVIL